MSALLGLDEFVAVAQVEEGGEWWVMIETTGSVVGCAECGTRAVGHGRRTVPMAGAALG